MSAQELRRRVAEKIGALRDGAAQASLNVRFRPSSLGSHFTPATTAEELAMYLIETNAYTRALTEALRVLDDSFRELFETDEKKPRDGARRTMETY